MRNIEQADANTRLYLVGLMASGKTIIGKALAQEMPNCLFFDTDAYIESRQKMSISEIVARSGWAAFRALESEALAVSKNLKNCIIATGGGLPCFHDNMQTIHNQGLSVFFNPPLTTILERLEVSNNTASRPLLKDISAEKLFDFLSEMYKQRAPIYSRADLEIDSSLSQKRVVERLARWLK
jgi:shikimate kinase